MPDLPERPRRQDRRDGRPQRRDPGQRSRTGQRRVDAEPAARRPLRPGQEQVRGHAVPRGADDQHLLLLDERNEAAVRRPQGPPGGQLRGRRRSAGTDLRRPDRLDAADPAAGNAGLREVRPLPARHGESEEADRRSQPVATATSRSGPTTKAPTTKPAPTTRTCSRNSASTRSSKMLNADNYFTVIGNQSTPDLDTGWIDWFEDYPHPNDFFQPLLAGESILPTNNTNFSQTDDRKLNAKITRLGEEQLGPEQEAEYAALDKEYMEQAPWAPYGTRTLSTFVSERDRPGQGHLQPDLRAGPDQLPIQVGDGLLQDRRVAVEPNAGRRDGASPGSGPWRLAYRRLRRNRVALALPRALRPDRRLRPRGAALEQARRRHRARTTPTRWNGSPSTAKSATSSTPKASRSGRSGSAPAASSSSAPTGGSAATRWCG